MLPDSSHNYYRKIVIELFVVITILIPVAMYYLKSAEAKSDSKFPNHPVETFLNKSATFEKLHESSGYIASKTAQVKQKAQGKVLMATTSASTLKNQELQPPQPSWSIRSVSSMKISKDRICNQVGEDYIRNWVKKAKELGVNYIALETPYDNPSCANALSYTKAWVHIIRENGIRVWHRHMPLTFEGIYDAGKYDSSDGFLGLITEYIRNNPDLFAAGDIFTPIPEPQNGGIEGVTHCAHGVCQFKSPSHFNRWLRDAIFASQDAFSQIGLSKTIKIGYYGFDGFVAWGHNNPDWNGILEDETVKVMGNITIDHYPELVGTDMKRDLDELERRYPGVPIVIGEWGTVTGGDAEGQVKKTMSAAKRGSVVGFGYWHMGTGGNESLINDDFSNREQFDEVQSFFK